MKSTLSNLSKDLKLLISSFLIVLTIGFLSGTKFLFYSNTTTPIGIEEHYNGNEFSDDQEVMKFKKSEKEILNIVHAHILSMSLIFLAIGYFLTKTDISNPLKNFLIVEPFVSIVLTFGGIYMLWLEMSWFTYVIMISGILLHVCYFLAVFLIFKELYKK